MTECAKNGQHQLPQGEESWKAERCDALVAAALDACAPCQTRLIAELCETLTDDFGKLFTTWVLSTLRLRTELGAPLPADALGMFPSGGAVLSPPGRKALRRVHLPRQAAGDMVAVDASGASATLAAMNPAERQAVLADALDGIVASISLGR